VRVRYLDRDAVVAALRELALRLGAERSEILEIRLFGSLARGERNPFADADLLIVLDASDLPGGVVNIVTGPKDALAKVLAEHDDVDAVWYFGNRAAAAEVERASAGNMKRTWAEWDGRDWMDNRQGEGREFLREATQVKNIWIPYGE